MVNVIATIIAAYNTNHSKIYSILFLLWLLFSFLSCQSRDKMLQILRRFVLDLAVVVVSQIDWPMLSNACFLGQVADCAQNSLHYSIQNSLYFICIMLQNVMHYSQNYSHEHCQNGPLTLEMIRYYCKAGLLYQSNVKLNNLMTVLLKYINVFSMTFWILCYFSYLFAKCQHNAGIIIS